MREKTECCGTFTAINCHERALAEDHKCGFCKKKVRSKQLRNSEQYPPPQYIRRFGDKVEEESEVQPTRTISPAQTVTSSTSQPLFTAEPYLEQNDSPLSYSNLTDISNSTSRLSTPQFSSPSTTTMSDCGTNRIDYAFVAEASNFLSASSNESTAKASSVILTPEDSEASLEFNKKLSIAKAADHDNKRAIVNQTPAKASNVISLPKETKVSVPIHQSNSVVAMESGQQKRQSSAFDDMAELQTAIQENAKKQTSEVKGPSIKQGMEDTNPSRINQSID